MVLSKQSFANRMKRCFIIIGLFTGRITARGTFVSSLHRLSLQHFIITPWPHHRYVLRVLRKNRRYHWGTFDTPRCQELANCRSTQIRSFSSARIEAKRRASPSPANNVPRCKDSSRTSYIFPKKIHL